MNLLTDYKLINDTFKSMAETVLINGVEQDCIVSTAYLGESEKRHISSLDRMGQGDLVEHRDKMYMIIEEVETPRHNKYRASMAHCDFQFEIPGEKTKIEVGRDSFGRPVYETVVGESTFVYAVINKLERNMALNSQMPAVASHTYIDVQENEANKIFFKVNNEFDFKDKRIRVVSHDLTNNGRLGLLAVFI